MASGLNKFASDIAKKITPLGYEYAGIDGGGHYVFRHRFAAPVRVPISPGKEPKQGYLTVAKRKVRDANSNGDQFLRMLCQRYGVGDTERKEININYVAEAREFASKLAKPVTPQAIQIAVNRTHRLVMVERSQPISRYVLSGLNADLELVETVEEDDGTEGVVATLVEHLDDREQETVKIEVPKLQAVAFRQDNRPPTPEAAVLKGQVLALLERELYPTIAKNHEAYRERADVLAGVVSNAVEQLKERVAEKRLEIEQTNALIGDLETAVSMLSEFNLQREEVHG